MPGPLESGSQASQEEAEIHLQIEVTPTSQHHPHIAVAFTSSTAWKSATASTTSLVPSLPAPSLQPIDAAANLVTSSPQFNRTAQIFASTPLPAAPRQPAFAPSHSSSALFSGLGASADVQLAIISSSKLSILQSCTTIPPSRGPMRTRCSIPSDPVIFHCSSTYSSLSLYIRSTQHGQPLQL